MSKVRFLLAVVALGSAALLTAACSTVSDLTRDSAVQAQGAATSTPVPTAAVAARPTYVVQRGTVEEVFTFTGRWQPRDQMMLSFPISGTVGQVNVRRGDAVRAGDLLAAFDTSDLESQLASAQIKLETALKNVSSSTGITMVNSSCSPLRATSCTSARS